MRNLFRGSPGKSAKIITDGDLSDWGEAQVFQAACEPPYATDYYAEGMMMYDDRFLYVAAHVGDPAPMLSLINPATDGEFGWKGGGIQVRLCTDRTLSWSVEANIPD